MLITSAPSIATSTPLAAAAANVVTLGLTRLRDVSLEPKAETTDLNRALADMRLDAETRAMLARKLAARLEGLTVLDDELPQRRYSKVKRECTVVRTAELELVILQIPGWVLKDGSQVEGLDLISYSLRGKTVRVLSPKLDQPAPVFNTLKRSWKEDESIDIEFIPWSQLAELEAGSVDVEDVLVLEVPKSTRGPQPARSATAAAANTRVFISYSHGDAEYVDEQKEKSLLGYLRGTLEREGFEFWWDRDLLGGDKWDDVIRQEIRSASIALVLVSQRFLNSKYCIDAEVEGFLEAQRNRGLVIFPVILSTCDWKSHPWLTSTQFEPRDGKTIETHYRERGDRDTLYLSIMDQLRAVRGRMQPSAGERASRS